MANKKPRYTLTITFETSRPMTKAEVIDLKLAVPFWMEDEKDGNDFLTKVRKTVVTQDV